MKGTPSACACMVAALARCTLAPRTCLQELRRLELREPLEPEAPHQTHPLHVGDQRHGLADERELLRTRRQREEDRKIRAGADHVAQQPHAVLVRPLEVIDEERDGPAARQRPHGHGGEVEHAQELLVRGQRLERRIVPTRDRVQHLLERLVRAVPVALEGRRRGEDAARDQERPPDLLVGGDGDRREALRCGQLRRREQEPRLADARLALERQRRQPPRLGGGELLTDRAELDLPPDHGSRDAASVQRQRRDGRHRDRGSQGLVHAHKLRESPRTVGSSKAPLKNQVLQTRGPTGLGEATLYGRGRRSQAPVVSSRRRSRC